MLGAGLWGDQECGFIICLKRHLFGWAVGSVSLEPGERSEPEPRDESGQRADGVKAVRLGRWTEDEGVSSREEPVSGLPRALSLLWLQSVVTEGSTKERAQRLPSSWPCQDNQDGIYGPVLVLPCLAAR